LYAKHLGLSKHGRRMGFQTGNSEYRSDVQLSGRFAIL